MLGQPLDPLARGLVERVIDPDHEMRGRDQVREAIAHQRADLAERLAGNQFAGELARHRHRDVDGFGLHPRRNAGKACRDTLEGDRDLLKRRFADGATTQSTSEQLGRSVDAVYKSLAKLRHTLFECIQKTLAREGRT